MSVFSWVFWLGYLLNCFYIHMRTSGGRKYLPLAQFTVSLVALSSSLRQKRLGITGFRRRRIIMRSIRKKNPNVKYYKIPSKSQLNPFLLEKEKRSRKRKTPLKCFCFSKFGSIGVHLDLGFIRRRGVISGD